MRSLVVGLILMGSIPILMAESDAQQAEYLDIDVELVYSEWYILDEDNQLLMMELAVTNNESFTLRDHYLATSVRLIDVDVVETGAFGNTYWYEGKLSELCPQDVKTVYPGITETWHVCFGIPFYAEPHMLSVGYRDGTSFHVVGFNSYLAPCHEVYEDEFCAPFTLDGRPTNQEWISACEDEVGGLRGALESWLTAMLGPSYGLQLLGMVANEPADCWEGLARSAVDYIDLLHGWSDVDHRFGSFETVKDAFYPEPQIIIKGANVTWSFQDSKGNEYSWFLPISVFEDSVKSGHDWSKQLYYDPLRLNLNGETIYSTNLRGFVSDDGVFTKVIDGIYDNSYDDEDFIYEVWYIVSQLTVYDEDVHPHSEGRLAMETLTRGGGDCEDLAILIADMLISSEHTEGWTVEYVYMDSDNPLDPETVNHVALKVEIGSDHYYMEPTAPPAWDYYPSGIWGWYFDVHWDGTYS